MPQLKYVCPTFKTFDWHFILNPLSRGGSEASQQAHTGLARAVTIVPMTQPNLDQSVLNDAAWLQYGSIFTVKK